MYSQYCRSILFNLDMLPTYLRESVNHERVIFGGACETPGADPEFYKGVGEGVAGVPWSCRINEACFQNVVI